MNIVLTLWTLKGLRDTQEFLGCTLRTAVLGLEIQTRKTQHLSPPSARGKTQRIFTAQYSTYCAKDRNGAMGAQKDIIQSCVRPHGWRERGGSVNTSPSHWCLSWAEQVILRHLIANGTTFSETLPLRADHEGDLGYLACSFIRIVYLVVVEGRLCFSFSLSSTIDIPQLPRKEPVSPHK